MKIAIIKETKTPPDHRVPFTPLQCRELTRSFPDLEIVIQPDTNRCFSDDEYRQYGICSQENVSDCNLLMGVKEVSLQSLIPEKTYMFFSHTAKKQKHNLELLRSVINKKIQLIDYEYLADDNKVRLVAFGRWAGIVGAYNAIRAFGLRYSYFNLKPAWQCKDLEELLSQLSVKPIKNQKVVITGGGRVASGAMEILNSAGFKKIEPNDFLSQEGNNFYAQLDPEFYVKHRSDRNNFEQNHFFSNPGEYENIFSPFSRSADILIACHYWDPRSPVLLTNQDILDPSFRIKIIADVSCDIPGPLPTTLRTSTIENPFYGYNVRTGTESDPFNLNDITIMSVDNLPGELPRDASEDFGNKLTKDVIPSILGFSDYSIIKRATIASNGRLTDNFSYLQAYLEGKE
jgi:saccharopine dehydrogenase (NAD+, L-lysine forming)